MNAFWAVTIIFALAMLAAGLYLSKKTETKTALRDMDTIKKSA